MAFCSQCGTSLPEGARFCPKCGTAAPSDTGSASDVPPTAFGAAAQRGAAPQPQPIPAQPALARRSGGPGWILPVMIVVALAVIGALLWSQRDGARPIAGDNASETAKADGDKAGNGKDAERAAAPEETAAAEDQAGGAGEGESEGATEAAAAESDTTPTTAASLDSAFNADPQGARARYAGPVTVSGVIATMVNPGPTPSLSLEGRTRLNFIVANFSAGSRGDLADLRKGDRVTLSCSGVNAIAGTTILQGCAVE